MLSKGLLFAGVAFFCGWSVAETHKKTIKHEALDGSIGDW